MRSPADKSPILALCSLTFFFFSVTDEINWPEKDEAPPSDSQDLITLLLRQNPLERLGTGNPHCSYIIHAL